MHGATSYNYTHIAIHITSRTTSGATASHSGRVPALYSAPRTHLSQHNIGIACSRTVRGVHHERHTGANIVSHAARRAPPPRRTTMDKIGTHASHDDDRVRSSPNKRAPEGHKETADTCNRSFSLHSQKSPPLVIRNTQAACKKRKHPKSHGLVSNGRGWPSSDARVGRHPPAAPAAARRLPALTPIAASCARRRLAPVGR